MQRIGYLQPQPLHPEQMNFRQAFAIDTMSYSLWLQFIFIPRVHESIAAQQLPSSSSVGTQAIREFDTVPEADQLVSLLCDFDALFS